MSLPKQHLAELIPIPDRSGDDEPGRDNSPGGRGLAELGRLARAACPRRARSVRSRRLAGAVRPARRPEVVVVSKDTDLLPIPGLTVENWSAAP